MKKDTRNYASLLQRFISAIIDTGLVSFIQVGLIFYLSVSQATSFEDFIVKTIMYWLAIGGLFLPILYFYLYSIEKWGGTPGKIISGLQIVHADGSFISKKDALFREMAYKTISYAPLGLGILAALKHPDTQTWHDEMAGTYVIQKENKLAVSAVIALCLIGAAIYLGYFIYNLGIERGLY